MHYQVEGFAQEEFPDESINVNFVCSWKTVETERGIEIEIENTRNGGWHISPTACPGGRTRFERFAQRLREVNGVQNS